jgi:hypothetical protein
MEGGKKAKRKSWLIICRDARDRRLRISGHYEALRVAERRVIVRFL